MNARVEYRELHDMVDTWHYANLTFRYYAKRLTLEHPRWEPLVVAASLDGAPVGLGLAQPEAGTNWAELLSLSVAEKLRGQGVATELLRRVEEACLARGIDTLYGHYMSGEDSTAAVERVLEKRAFSVPVPRMLAVRCSLESISHAPWIKRYKLPPHFEILPWTELSEAERAQIRQSNAAAPWIPDDLLPFLFEADIEPVTSLALRVRGEIRGWVINHLVEGMLRFTCSYMHPEQQRLGRILLLYNEAVRRSPSRVRP
jgi:GNAT superfamily N-acetyltransferase